MRAALENAIRAWLVLAGASGGVPTADSAVIIADQDTVRPPIPYLSVRVLLHDVVVGEDEDIVDDSDPPTWRQRGQRTATVSVNAFGASAEGWLERAVRMLRAPAVRAQLGTAGFSVRPEGALNNLSALLDDATQVRFERDFFVDYAVLSDAVDVVELAEVVHEDTFESGAGDLVQTVTEVL